MADQHPGAGGGARPGDTFEPNAVFVAPPRADDDYDLPEPPKWPKVVGIISIVLAGLGLLCGGCGVLSTIFMPQFMNQVAPDMGPLPPTMQPGPLYIAIMVFSLLWSVLLLVAGITLLNRRPPARTMHLVWAAGSLVLFVIGVYNNFQIVAEMTQWAKDNPDSQFAQSFNPTVQLATGLGTLAIFGLPWPVFCLVWFGFIKTRPEQMTGGAVEPAA